MIKHLQIQNFKSLRGVTIECNRINIFIGEPNSGKSNFLELLGLLSWFYHLRQNSAIYGRITNSRTLHDFVRYKHTLELFSDQDINHPIYAKFDGTELRIDKNLSVSVTLPLINYYRFKSINQFTSVNSDFLLPPDGENLFDILQINKELRIMIQDLLKKFDYRLVLRSNERVIEFQSSREDLINQYSYGMLSETLQKVIFLLAIFYTNKDAIITLEEPDSGTFPYYAKFIGDKIARDNNGNQFFITTHNPYFLLPILEKTREVTVFKTYWEDNQTKMSPIDNEKILGFDTDLFFNLDKL